jgi:hypothetical protein
MNGQPGAGPGYDCYGNDAPAVNAVVIQPSALTKIGNALYFTEAGRNLSSGRGNRIRKIDLTTGIISLVAGSAAPGTGPCTFAGERAPAKQALLCNPSGLVATPEGDLVVSDTGNFRIRGIRLATSPVGNIETIAGSSISGRSGDEGPSVNATLAAPSGLAFDVLGNLAFTDETNHNIRWIDSNGIIHLFAGGNPGFGFSGDGSFAIGARMWSPSSITVRPGTSTVVFADSLNERIREIR